MSRQLSKIEGHRIETDDYIVWKLRQYKYTVSYIRYNIRLILDIIHLK